MNQIRQKAQICLRKNKGHIEYTAGQLKSQDFVKQLIHHDDGYRVFKELRGSPPYWEQVKKELFALIRSLGIPTWFTSFSSAETRWEHLLKILGRTVKGKELSDEEIRKLTWQQKCELIQQDPVTCARHFDHQVQGLIHRLLQNKLNPVGKVSDFFYKVEFQMRGSPHIHMLLWIKDAPKLEDGNEEDVVNFIDQHVTCARGEDDLIGRQDHAHSRTCRKNGKNVCRFNFPQPPLSETIILEPLPEEMPEKDKVAHRKNWEKVGKALNDIKKAKSITYEDFLKKIPLSEEDYILSIRSSIKRKTIFLQRAPDESRINNYNAPLLKSWRANMDIQYVLDAFSCAMYIVSYIAKSQRGMSNLLYNACKEAKRGNLDLKKQVYMIGNKFLNHVEVSAQEAVYYILQQQLYKASRDVVFVNTAPQEERVVMLKSHRIIKGLPNDSIDVEAAGLITHYSQRPECLEDMVLADYCSKYRRERSRGKSTVCNNEDDVEKNDDDDDVEFNGDDVENKEDNAEKNEDDVENKEDDAENIEHAVEYVKDAVENTENSVEKNHDVDSKEFYILKGGYRLVKRRKRAALRYVHYHPEKDREHHFREILMLFRPWRVENSIIRGSSSYEEEFQKAEKEVCGKMKEYNYYSDALEKAMKDLKEMEEENLEEEWNKNAPNTQYAEKKDEEEGSKPSDTFP